MMGPTLVGSRVLRRLKRQRYGRSQPTDGGTTTTDPPKPTIKPRKVIEPAKLTGKPYLVTQADIDGFLDALRKQLEEAVNDGRRIKIK